MPTFKTEEEIYTSMKQGVIDDGDLPITNWSSGSTISAFLKVIATAIRIIYIVLQQIYFNMFPQDADRESLKRFYGMWGLDWNSPETETARLTVFNKYQKKSVIGTVPWYKDTVLSQFASIVNQAACYPNHRGPGTTDLVLMRNNRPIYPDDLETIRAFFAQDGYDVCEDLLIRTTEVNRNAS